MPRGLALVLTLAMLGTPTTLASTAPIGPDGLDADQRGRGTPPVSSPDVSPDRRITFRVRAADATSVRVIGGDMPSIGRGEMSKDEAGVWIVTVGPLPGGAYRYVFNVDGVAAADPVNPSTSESNNTVWSLAVVPGDARFDVREVPHGAVAEVIYHSTTLERTRRLHVYTPPGYEAGSDPLPVLYLLHGAGDSDDSWSSVGRAGFILDNLIAAGDAVPMLVVMPAGHTQRSGGAGMGDEGTMEFVREFIDDVVPTIEARYRTTGDRTQRAIAGLSMGGHQSLHVALRHLDRFAYIGVFSSGLIGAFADAEGGGPPALSAAGRRLEEQLATELADTSARAGLRSLWFATGEDDFLLPTTRGTVALLERHGFTPEFDQTAGGHTWLNWRDYLARFVPRLFR